MQIAIKVIWITAIVAVFLSMTWFLLGSTAFFQRGIDLVTTCVFVLVWTPALICIAVSIKLLKKGWMPSSNFAQIGLSLVIIILSIIFSSSLLTNVNTEGFLTERVTKNGILQVTADGKYEYQIELINLFQKNSSARLSVKDILTGEEATIPVDINTRKIKGVVADFLAWTEMTPTNKGNIYILTTTEDLNETDIQVFEIDMETKKSRRIE